MLVDKNGKSAITNFYVIKIFRNMTLLKAITKTGRMHQIRAHAQHINHPIKDNMAVQKNKPTRSKRETFDESSEILKYDLWKIVNNGPCDILNQTEITQPAILSASFAIWKVWKKLSGQNPQFMAGHSLGEYSALVCANSLSFSDAIKIVALRGKFMQESVNNKILKSYLLQILILQNK
ncbi:hypothetical protein GQX74_015783 [Glossina fuscipes]|nr:hypothetical protein GQX74_015783 [Glossina fuscipes]